MFRQRTTLIIRFRRRHCLFDYDFAFDADNATSFSILDLILDDEIHH